MPRRIRRMFAWIEPNRNTNWTCTIDGVDIHDFMVGDPTFSFGLISEELTCEIELDDSGEQFSGRFKQRHVITFKMDFTDGTTTQFEGEVDEVKSRIVDGFFKIFIKGSHYTGQLADIMITEEFTDATISDIKKSLIGNLSEFTTNNVETTKDSIIGGETLKSNIDIRFVNLPLLDCLIRLDKVGNEDSFIGNDKDYNSFKRNSKENDKVALTWNGSIIELRGLGTDSTDVRNKIQVYGKAGGLPVIFTSEDSTSQINFRLKEQIITENITSEDQAEFIAKSIKVEKANPLDQGSASTLFMVGLNPGDRVYIISPPHKIHDRFRFIKHTFHPLSETMEVFFGEERTITKLIRDRIIKDIGEEDIVNPFKMSQSFNFGSDGGFDTNKVDGSSSSANEIVDGFLQLVSGNESGNMISNIRNTPITVSDVHLLLKGEHINSANYYVNADGTDNWQKILPNILEEVKVKGNKLRLRIEMLSTDLKIESAALLHK